MIKRIFLHTVINEKDFTVISNYLFSAISSKEQKALDYYMKQPDGNELDNFFETITKKYLLNSNVDLNSFSISQDAKALLKILREIEEQKKERSLAIQN